MAASRFQADFEFGELLGCLIGLQSLNHIVEIALHDGGQLVEREVDAVVAQAALGKL